MKAATDSGSQMTDEYLYSKFYETYRYYDNRGEEIVTKNRAIHEDNQWSGELSPPRDGTNPVDGITQYEVFENTPIKFIAKNEGMDISVSVKYISNPNVISRSKFHEDILYKDLSYTEKDHRSFLTKDIKNIEGARFLWIYFKQPGFCSIKIVAQDPEGPPGVVSSEAALSEDQEEWIYDFIVHSKQQVRKYPVERILTILGYISTLWFAKTMGKKL